MSKSKNNLLKFQCITNHSMVTSITTNPTSIKYLDDVGFQFNFTGSPTGTFSIQVSADYAAGINGEVQDPGNWVSLMMTYYDGANFITTTEIPATSGSPIYLDLALLSAPWIRAVYNSDASAGTLNAFITAKEI